MKKIEETTDSDYRNRLRRKRYPLTDKIKSILTKMFEVEDQKIS